MESAQCYLDPSTTPLCPDFPQAHSDIRWRQKKKHTQKKIILVIVQLNKGLQCKSLDKQLAQNQGFHKMKLPNLRHKISSCIKCTPKIRVHLGIDGSLELQQLFLFPPKLVKMFLHLRFEYMCCNSKKIPKDQS